MLGRERMGPFHMSYGILWKTSPITQIKACRHKAMLWGNQNSPPPRKTIKWHLTLNIPSLARQRCLPSWGPRRTPWFFCNFSTVWCGTLLKLCFLGFWNYNSVIQALLASNILCLFISTEVTGGTELLHTHSSLIQHLNNGIFWALSVGHFSNLQRSEPKTNKNNNIPHL